MYVGAPLHLQEPKILFYLEIDADERGSRAKAGRAWMNNRKSIMDGKLTKFFIPLSVSPFLPVFSTCSSSSPCSTLSVIACHCFEAHVSGRRPPLASSAEPLSCLWKRAASLQISCRHSLLSLCFSEREVRLEDEGCKVGRLWKRGKRRLSQEWENLLFYCLTLYRCSTKLLEALKL